MASRSNILGQLFKSTAGAFERDRERQAQEKALADAEKRQAVEDAFKRQQFGIQDRGLDLQREELNDRITARNVAADVAAAASRRQEAIDEAARVEKENEVAMKQYTALVARYKPLIDMAAKNSPEKAATLTDMFLAEADALNIPDPVIESMTREYRPQMVSTTTQTPTSVPRIPILEELGVAPTLGSQLDPNTPRTLESYLGRPTTATRPVTSTERRPSMYEELAIADAARQSQIKAEEDRFNNVNEEAKLLSARVEAIAPGPERQAYLNALAHQVADKRLDSDVLNMTMQIINDKERNLLARGAAEERAVRGEERAIAGQERIERTLAEKAEAERKEREAEADKEESKILSDFAAIQSRSSRLLGRLASDPSVDPDLDPIIDDYIMAERNRKAANVSRRAIGLPEIPEQEVIKELKAAGLLPK